MSKKATNTTNAKVNNAEVKELNINKVTTVKTEVLEDKKAAKKEEVKMLKMVNRYGEVVTYKPVSDKALKAKITAYSNAERTEIVKTFNTFVEAKKWLGVTNVGNSLENASAKGTKSRGYYWTVV